MSWHIEIGGVQIILKTSISIVSQTEYASLKNTVGFRITENNLYQIIFISSEPFHKIIAMSMLEICSYDCCRGQKDVLLSATCLWTSDGFGLEESQNPWPSLSHLQEHVHRREVRGSSLSLRKSSLFLGGYQQTQSFLWLLVRGSLVRKLQCDFGKPRRKPLPNPDCEEVHGQGSGRSCSSTSSSGNYLFWMTGVTSDDILN